MQYPGHGNGDHLVWSVNISEIASAGLVRGDVAKGLVSYTKGRCFFDLGVGYL